MLRRPLRVTRAPCRAVAIRISRVPAAISRRNRKGPSNDPDGASRMITAPLPPFAGLTLDVPRIMGLPKVSPKKTWSGLAGAMVSAAVAAVVFVGFLDDWGANLNQYAAMALFGAIIGVVGQFGDMVESGIKRHFGVKDMGTMIPGHGGLFDRVDGLMFVAPAIALLKVLFPEGIAL